jgi:hypothetical protein
MLIVGANVQHFPTLNESSEKNAVFHFRRKIICRIIFPLAQDISAKMFDFHVKKRIFLLSRNKLKNIYSALFLLPQNIDSN